jgi:hypothetical protein
MEFLEHLSHERDLQQNAIPDAAAFGSFYVVVCADHHGGDGEDNPIPIVNQISAGGHEQLGEHW